MTSCMLVSSDSHSLSGTVSCQEHSTLLSFRMLRNWSQSQSTMSSRCWKTPLQCGRCLMMTLSPVKATILLHLLPSYTSPRYSSLSSRSTRHLSKRHLLLV